ncbi:hypothetical protein C0992_008258 [Termitomyces sp. T32_za158]|nr:hypothetical protein C0992_008258 [Termitomyces sp. T32_za158]
MFRFARKSFHPPARRGSFSVVTDLGVALQRFAFVTSLWCILLNALSPNTNITLFAIHPLFSSSSFKNPPTPPSKAAKPIKAPRREEALKSTTNPSSIALFVCFAVAHTISRHVPDVLETQRKPAVSDGRGIEESLDIIPVPNPPSDEESLVKPAATSGRGIEEYPDVTTTPIHGSTSNEGNIDTDEQTDEINHDNPQILCNTAENADTSVTDIQGILAVLYVLATTEKTDDEQLRALAKHIRAHHPHGAPEATTQEATDEVNIDKTSTQTEATERVEDVGSKHEESIEDDEEVDVKDEVEVEEPKEMEEEPEVLDDQETKDEVIDERATAEVELDVERESNLANVVVKDAVEETKEFEEEAEASDDQDTKKESTDECAPADVASDAEFETEPEEFDIDTTESRDVAAEKSNDVEAAAKPEEDTNEDNDAGEWFTIRKGKAVRISSRPVPSPVPVPTSVTIKEIDTATSPSTVAGSAAPASEESVAEVPTPESQCAATETRSQEEDWFEVCGAEELQAAPPKTQAIPSRRYIIVPANNPNWLEEKAEHRRKAIESWNEFKEAERAAERAKVEEEERKAREVEEAKAARFANFDTAMDRLDGLLKVTRQKREKKEQEDKKIVQDIGSAQTRINELIDMDKVRAMFDPQVLKTSSFSSVVGQETTISEPDVPPSSAVTYADNASVLQENAADLAGPFQVLPSAWDGAARTEGNASIDNPSKLQQNAAGGSGHLRVLSSGMRQGTTGTKKTIERRLRRQRNRVRRLNAEAALTSNDDGGGESPHETALENGLRADLGHC